MVSNSRFRTFMTIVLAVSLPGISVLLASYLPSSIIGIVDPLADSEAPEGSDYSNLVWDTHCGGCHSVGNRAPSAELIAQNAARRKPGMSAEEYLLESILTPSKFRVPGYSYVMPDNAAAGLTRNEIRGILHYLLNKPGTADWEKLNKLNFTPLAPDKSSEIVVDLEQVKRGREIFEKKGGCAKCHDLNQVVGFDLLAPTIFGSGLLSEPELLEAVFDPDKKIMAKYRQAVVQMPDGRVIQGRVMNEGTEKITLLLTDEQGSHPKLISLLPDSDGEVPVVKLSTETSAMPGNYAKLLSPAEQKDLLAFLRTMVSRR